MAVPGLDGAGIGKTHATGMLANSNAEGINQPAKGRMCAHVLNDYSYAIQKSGIVEDRLAASDSISTELPGVSQQSRRVGGHSSKSFACEEWCRGAQFSGADRSDNSRRSCADYTDSCFVHTASRD